MLLRLSNELATSTSERIIIVASLSCVLFRATVEGTTVFVHSFYIVSTIS